MTPGRERALGWLVRAMFAVGYGFMFFGVVALVIAVPRGAFLPALAGVAVVLWGVYHAWQAGKLLSLERRVFRVTLAMLAVDNALCVLPWIVVAFDPARDRWTGLAALGLLCVLPMLIAQIWILRPPPAA